MTPEDLKRIANSGSYGSGKAVRDKAAAEREALSLLPEPEFMNEFVAADNGGHLVPLCHFGCSNEDGKDWGIYHDGHDYHNAALFGIDAKSDARAVAAVLNAYRMGLLVRADQ